MYESFYNFSIKPFSLNPDPRFFYGSKEHNRVMAYLQYGLNQGEGFIVVSGDVGTGKTTLVTSLMDELRRNKNIMLSNIVTTQLGPDDLLRMVANSFGLESEGLSKSTLLANLQEYLKVQLDEGKKVLLIVDEAQNLEPHSLEELRMLSNFQQGTISLVQSFLLGQGEFRDTLRRPELEQFRQRVIASYHLGPLNQQETRSYIEHRLKVAGWKGDPAFALDAYKDIFEATNGVPRRINSLCDRILLYSYTEEVHDVDANLVTEVIKELDNEIHFNRGDNASFDSSERRSNGNGNDRYNNLEKRIEKIEATIEGVKSLIKKF